MGQVYRSMKKFVNIIDVHINRLSFQQLKFNQTETLTDCILGVAAKLPVMMSVQILLHSSWICLLVSLTASISHAEPECKKFQEIYNQICIQLWSRIVRNAVRRRVYLRNKPLSCLHDVVF